MKTISEYNIDIYNDKEHSKLKRDLINALNEVTSKAVVLRNTKFCYSLLIHKDKRTDLISKNSFLKDRLFELSMIIEKFENVLISDGLDLERFDKNQTPIHNGIIRCPNPEGFNHKSVHRYQNGICSHCGYVQEVNNIKNLLTE